MLEGQKDRYMVRQKYTQIYEYNIYINHDGEIEIRGMFKYMKRQVDRYI